MPCQRDPLAHWKAEGQRFWKVSGNVLFSAQRKVGEMCVWRDQNKMHLVEFTSVLLFHLSEWTLGNFASFKCLQADWLLVKAKRHFFYQKKKKSSEKHLATLCVHKKLNKCHSVHMKIQKVPEDREHWGDKTASSAIEESNPTAHWNQPRGLQTHWRWGLH